MINPALEPRRVAMQVAGWTNLGVELPKELTTALDRFDALRHVEIGNQPAFNVEAVTANNAESKIREFADALATHIPLDIGGAQISVLESAKASAVQDAAVAVNKAAAQAVPQIIEQLEPEFEEHAQAYSEAAVKLPDEVTSDVLVSAGTDALDSYVTAKAEAVHITRIGSWLSQTAGVYGTLSTETFLHVLAPEYGSQLSKLDEVNASGRVDRTYHAIVPVYFTAARLGVPFRLNTHREAAQLRADLKSPMAAHR